MQTDTHIEIISPCHCYNLNVVIFKLPVILRVRNWALW